MLMDEQIDPQRVAAYIRWSTDDQGEGTTLAVQTESCRHYLQSQGWHWQDDLCFVDDGYSGGSLDRPGMAALRRAVADGLVQCVVVYKLDRLSRSVVDTVNLVLEEWGDRCYLKSTREPIDTATPAGKMFFYLLVSYAEWERSVIRERTLAGKRRRAQEGKNPGMTLPYGYRPGGRTGDIVVDEDQAAVVRRIFNDYVRGKSLRTIAADLNQDGLSTKFGTLWRSTSIRWMLRNESYKGVLAYGKTRKTTRKEQAAGKRSYEAFAEPRHALVEGGFPAIVDPLLWAEAQALAAQRAREPRRSLPAHYLLSGIARCRCGSPLTGNASGGGAYRFYRCTLRDAAGRPACSARGIPAHDLEQGILAAIRAEYGPQNAGGLLDAVAKGLQEQIQTIAAGLAESDRTLAEVQRRLRRLHHAFDEGGLAPQLYSQRVGELLHGQGEMLGRRAALAAQREELLRRIESVKAPGAEVGIPLDQAQALDALSREEQKQILRHLVEQLTVWRKGEEREERDRRRQQPVVEVDLVLRR